MKIKLDNGQRRTLDPERHAHLDHGYAVTSHSSQGQTADRVLIHVDTELAAKDLLNNRMAYVAVSRGQWDAQIFTNDRSALANALGRDISHQSAYQPAHAIAPLVQEIAKTQIPEHDLSQGIGMGLGM
jgi:ATP-dependent exoDNAse (exonuclease V) alpha subunit